MFGWQRAPGAKYEVDWDMSLKVGNSLMSSTYTAPDEVSPTSTWRLDGETLPQVTAYRQQKRQELNTYPIAFANPDENEVLADSGAIRQIIIRGEVSDSTGLNTFDQRIQSLIGRDVTVDFESAWPGRTKEVMVRSFDGTREAGYTRRGEFTIEMVEGYATTYSGGEVQ